MSAQPSTHNADDVLVEVERLVGALASGQRATVINAIRQDAIGVLALAKRISNSTSVHAPAAVFCASINRGDHLKRERAEQRNPDRIPPAEAFRRLYNAKIAELRDVTDWPMRQMVDFAIDYAASSLDRCQITAFPLGQNVNTLEDDLRREINQPRYPEPAKARA